MQTFCCISNTSCYFLTCTCTSNTQKRHLEIFENFQVRGSWNFRWNSSLVLLNVIIIKRHNKIITTTLFVLGLLSPICREFSVKISLKFSCWQISHHCATTATIFRMTKQFVQVGYSVGCSSFELVKISIGERSLSSEVIVRTHKHRTDCFARATKMVGNELRKTSHHCVAVSVKW